jgi:hypothetical protein
VSKKLYFTDEEKREAKRANARERYHADPELKLSAQRRSRVERGDELRALDNARRAKYRARVREQSRRAKLQRSFGITVEQYDRMLRAQDGKCALCRRPPKSIRLAVDHDHRTGRVRGLLCFRCNKFQVGGHTVESARAVVSYLESPFDGRAA